MPPLGLLLLGRQRGVRTCVDRINKKLLAGYCLYVMFATAIGFRVFHSQVGVLVTVMAPAVVWSMWKKKGNR